MNSNKREDYLIVVSTIVAILSTKIADFILPKFIDYKFFKESTLNPWLGLLFGVVTLIVFTLVFFLPTIKWLTKRIMDDD